MNHLVNSIPGGIATQKVWKDRILFPLIFPDGVTALSGHTWKNMKTTGNKCPDIIYEQDRERAGSGYECAAERERGSDASYRMP